MIGSDSKQSLQYASGAVLNPRAPFKDTIRKLRFGDLIVINGRVAPKVKRFSVDLCNQLDNDKMEYVMHLNPRFDKHEIVRNSTINGNWGPEERFGGLAGLSSDADFECVILVHTDCYKIAFNKKHYCDYRHRLPYQSVNTLCVTGEVAVSSVHVQPGPVGQVKHKDGTQPLAMPAFPGSPQRSPRAIDPATDHGDLPGGYNLEMPYVASIPEGVKQDQAVYISALPHNTASSFAVNLRVGNESTSDIAFHMRADFGTKVCILSCFVDGDWGRQREITVFPFKCGMHFDLIVKCDADVFQVSVNNTHYGQLHHQVKDLSKISGLQIEGDLNLVHVRMR